MKTIRVAFCLCIALLFCQLPSFTKQYAIRLEAHIAELTKIIHTYSKQNPTPPQPQEKFYTFLLQRNSHFQKALSKIQSSNPIFYPLWMVAGFDQEIMKEAWYGYTPSLFLDWASLIWGLIGGLTTSIGIELFLYFIRKKNRAHSV
jgi:hypothetical protein